jgi:predicted ATP-dependent serine protease
VGIFPNPETAAERLAMMIEGAPPYEPPKKRTIEDVAMPVSDFLSLEIPERRTLLHPWLKTESINLISGWRGLGKTWFGLGIVNAVSKGEPYGPWKAEQPAPCLFLDGEMSLSDLRERVHALDCTSPQLQVYSDHLANQWGQPRAHLCSEEWRDRMTALLKNRGIRLFVLDNISSLAPGIDENLKRDWDAVNQWLLDLRFNGISTILLHHVGKGGSQRGTSAREDNLDSSLTLRHPNDYLPEQGARFVVNFSKTQNISKISRVDQGY